MSRIARLIFYILVALLGLSFTVLNSQNISVNYYFGTWQSPLSLALVLALALGTLIGVVTCLGLLMKLKNEVATLRKAAKLSEVEVINSRGIPFRDTP